MGDLRYRFFIAVTLCITFAVYIYINYTYRDPKPKQWVPVVFWHGMGDSCCNPLSLGKVKKYIEDAIGPDESGNKIYIFSIGMGNNIVEDTLDGYFMNVNKQVDYACELIKNDSKLANGYNAVGFSQGSQFLRAVAQRCPNPKMRNLISIGGQHQGVYGLPHCTPNNTWCNTIRKLLNDGAYFPMVQNHLVQAEYWHDPLNEDEYRNKSIFLADINNERLINNEYIKNLQSLENLVLVMFNNDTMVMPKESSWFGFYTIGQAVNITSLQDSSLYIEDRLGLKKMNNDGKLQFLSVNGDHLRFTLSWFIKEIINPYLHVTT